MTSLPHFLRSIAKSLALSFPPVKRLYEQREMLLEEVSRLQAKPEEVSCGPVQLQDGTEQTPRWGTPSYDSDYLRVWNRNTDFLHDKRFLTAYRAGINSGHKLGETAGEEPDIHIEWRILVCCWAAWHARHLAGDFVECGTNTGIMSLAICNYLDFNKTGKNFYLFDTFCGIPTEQMTDRERAAGREQENTVFDECYDRAVSNFSPYPSAHLVRGKVPDTLSSQPIEKVCYLMLDMNIVYPEQAALAYFWDKLVPGAIVLFDDYGWSGYALQKEAHDAFALSKGVEILNLPTGQGMLIKP